METAFRCAFFYGATEPHLTPLGKPAEFSGERSGNGPLIGTSKNRAGSGWMIVWPPEAKKVAISLAAADEADR